MTDKIKRDLSIGISSWIGRISTNCILIPVIVSVNDRVIGQIHIEMLLVATSDIES